MLMIRHSQWIWLALAWSMPTAAVSDDLVDEVDPSQHCRLWMAPSSTGTENQLKFGIFAGVDFTQNDTIPNPEIGIPLIDFVDSHNRDNEVNSRIVDVLESFLWTSDFAGSKWEGNYSAPIAIPGIGVLANYHSGTYNVDWRQGSVLLRDRPETPATGVPHPSRGAITPYENFTMYATENITAGMELFSNFGDVWDGNYTDDIYQDKLTRWDYMDADRLLDTIIDFMEKYDDQMTADQKDNVLDFILEKILGTAAGKHAKVIRSLIPAHPGKLKRVKEMGGTFAYRNSDLVKSQKWLHKHGMCLDNLRAGPSTIPEAGRGAFATRKIKSGDVVAPSPMLHIPNKEIMNMYEIKEVPTAEGGTRPVYDRTKPIGQQLLVNYCFGHPESTMLLLPIGSMVSLINHKPTGAGANAYITWSKHKSMPNEHGWHDKTPRELVDYEHLGIVMRVVAMRDIEEGEEIFIDYGNDWQYAWDRYMKGFTAYTKDHPEWSIQAEDMKATYKEKPFETPETVKENPYPAGVYTACFLETTEMEDGKPKKNEDGLEIALFSGPKKFEDYLGNQFFICDVIDRKKVDDGNFYNYTVITQVNPEYRAQVEEVPHRAITFIDKPYSGDIHTRGAFRHYIGILDHHFPQMWRNKREA